MRLKRSKRKFVPGAPVVPRSFHRDTCSTMFPLDQSSNNGLRNLLFGVTVQLAAPLPTNLISIEKRDLWYLFRTEKRAYFKKGKKKRYGSTCEMVPYKATGESRKERRTTYQQKKEY